MPSIFKINIAIKIIVVIFLVLFLTVCSFGQSSPLFFKLYCPSKVLTNSDFSISLISKVSEPQADRIMVGIYLDEELALKNVILNQRDLSINENFINSNYKNHTNAQFIDINCKSTNFNLDNVYQLIFKVNSKKAGSTKIGFSISYYLKDSLLAKFTSLDNSNMKFNLGFAEIDFYEKSVLKKTSSLQFESHSSLYIYPISKIEDDVKVDFWVKPFSKLDQFFQVVNERSGEVIYSLSRNKFGIAIPEITGEVITQSDYFISDNVWNHIEIRYSNSKNEFSTYINSNLVAVDSPSNLTDLRNSSYFFSSDANSKFELYAFSVQNKLKNESVFQLSSKNKKENSWYKIFYLNPSEIENRNFGYNFLPYNLTISNDANAPVFSEKPELNVVVHNTFYELNWKSVRNDLADYFIIEKSENGNNYVECGTVSAKFDANNYYFSEAKTLEEGVVFFRIRQINKDKTESYSQSVKIGFSKITEFNLEQNYPNPFNPETQISVEILVPGEYKIFIYDVTGKNISTLHQGFLSAGNYNFTFTASELPSGIYFYEIKSPNSNQVKKMILAK